MVHRRFPSSGAARFVLYHPDFAAVKTTLPRAGQEACRTPEKIFLRHENFNICVDKLVEIHHPLTANFSPFNTLLLFAPFECNFVFSHARRRSEKSYDGGKIIRSKSSSGERRPIFS
jgi:hypothetical protein